MDLNADFSRRILVHADELAWKASPMAGVERRMLDRIGGEVARATSIVRYAPGSTFSAHTHDGGEEFLVLEGTFQDENGDYPTGTYVRNPPTTSHIPGSKDGCTILVKLWQFDEADRTHMRLPIDTAPTQIENGAAILELHVDDRERVTFETWPGGIEISRQLPGGGELFVLDGTLENEGEKLRKQSWLRLPSGSTLNAQAGPNGAKVWIKTGHLPFARAPKP